MDIFVGNLLFATTEGDVKKLFEGFGNVASAVIVMEKEKKAPKSRGFGFVQMPDEQQALVAIAALNGKEFMGRVLNVNPVRPKTETRQESKLQKKAQPKLDAASGEHSRQEGEERKIRFNPAFPRHLAFPDHNVRSNSGSRQRLLDGREEDRRVFPFGQPGTYKGGRRTRSYMKRQGLSVMQEEAKPRKRSQDNPMRWRKKKNQAKPWQKSPGGHKPWEKTEGEVRPREKAEGDSKPWRKSGGGIKPWKKPAGDSKPWSKNGERAQKSKFRGRKKPDGYKR